MWNIHEDYIMEHQFSFSIREPFFSQDRHTENLRVTEMNNIRSIVGIKGTMQKIMKRMMFKVKWSLDVK